MRDHQDLCNVSYLLPLLFLLVATEQIYANSNLIFNLRIK